MKKPGLTLASLAVLALGATSSLAATMTYTCGMNHYVRSGGTEMVTSAFTIRNRDTVYPATVMRLTIRDLDGNVVYDAGPLTSTPLPLNQDFPVAYPGGKDITVVPPLGAIYLRTNQIWGNFNLPSEVGGGEKGQMLTGWIVVSKEGPRSALLVTALQRARARNATTGLEGDTRDSNGGECQLVLP